MNKEELEKLAEEFADSQERRGCGAWWGLKDGFIAGFQKQINIDFNDFSKDSFFWVTLLADIHKRMVTEQIITPAQLKQIRAYLEKLLTKKSPKEGE